jgi:hypothetical protein
MASTDAADYDWQRTTPPARRNVNRRPSLHPEGSECTLPDTARVRDNHQGANERLYEAYNELHALAQDFQKPFDAPAVLVVGHQTDGKSALVEALMGFQFNHVGGGTKTRRPIALHMKYNPTALQPACYLLSEDQGEQEVSLQQLQVS